MRQIGLFRVHLPYIISGRVAHRDAEADIMVVLYQLLNLTTTQLEDIDRDLREGQDEMYGLAKLILIYGPKSDFVLSNI